MSPRLLTGLGLALTAVAFAASSVRAAPGQRFAVYGADTTAAERTELAALFGVDPNAQAQTVTTPEMVAALQNTGLPVAATDKSISSSGLTCLNKGDGLTVQVQNITRITAPVYANALLAAGVGDGIVVIAAPTDNPVTGETALVGALKAFPQCQGGGQVDANRAQYAYQEVAYTVALAGPSGDLNKASDVMLKAVQPVLTGQARDDTTVGQALDQAAQADSIAVDPSLRPTLVQFLKSLGALDYGTYAKGYQVQQSSPTQVKVLPAGAGAPTTAAQATATPAAPVSSLGAVSTFSGTVQNTGTSLTVKKDGGGTTGVTPATNLVVTRNSKSAVYGDIKKGDTVTVATNPDGTAARIDAKSKGGTDLGFLKWLIPLLVLLLLLLLLMLWLLGRRKKSDFVLEPDAVQSPRRDSSGGGPTGNRPRGSR